MGSILFDGRSMTSEQFDDRVARAMTGLHNLGVAEGDAVLMLLRNDPAFLEASIAIGKLGASAVPANWHGHPDEIRTIVIDSGARLAIVHDDLALSHRDGLSGDVTTVVVTTGGVAARPGSLDWEALLRNSAPYFGAAVRPRGALIYTSGTTSAPKAIEREGMSPAQERQMAESLRLVYGLRPGMRALICGPLYHAMSASYARSVLAAMGDDGVLMIEPRFEAQRLLELVQEHRITHLLMVPVMFVRLLRLAQQTRQRFDLSSIESVIHSAAPCSLDVKRAMIDWWGPVIREFYGSSETGPVSLITSEQYLNKPGSVGQALPGCTIRIIDDTGDPVVTGTPGEVTVRNSAYPDFTYRRHPEERTKLDRNGLIASGDIGYLDPDGYLYMLDRKKDMVITGGVNVFPAEIEAILLDLPGVKDCAVFGIPDAEFGESMAAHIERSAGHEVDAAAITEYLRARLPGYKVPKVIRFDSSLPREDNGKIYKRRLADAYWQGTGRRI